MPFQSRAQERFMYSQHPDIAKRWASEFGHVQGGNTKTKHNSKPSGTDSNESFQPKTAKLPRKGGFQRDFANLKPSASKRFAPTNRPKPNEQEAMKEFPVQTVPGSFKGKLANQERQHKGFHARDVSVASAGLNQGGNPRSAM